MNLENCEKALNSNKEDTSLLVSELGEIYTEYLQLMNQYDKMKKQIKNSEIVFHTTIGVTCGVMMGFSVYQLCNKDSNGLIFMGITVGVCVVGETVYCLGHKLGKLW